MFGFFHDAVILVPEEAQETANTNKIIAGKNKSLFIFTGLDSNN